MSLEEELVSVGFKPEEAAILLKNDHFHHKRKDSSELTRIIDEIQRVYGFTFEEVKKAILRFPLFVNYNHSRAVHQATEVYGDEAKVKKAILRYPQFVGLNHSRVVSQATEVYGDEDRVREIILTHPKFVGYNHSRAVHQATEVYGDENKVKKAVLRYPSFAGLDHSRVMRQKGRLGRMAGLTKEETINHILNNPVLAGYSVKRYLAAFDVARSLEKEGFPQDENMFNAFMLYSPRSSYVPDSKRRRISQVPDGKEPQLMAAVRKRLSNSSSESYST